ncbi:MAG: DUF1800 family protein, partial [Solirubrobacterales bacterium]
MAIPHSKPVTAERKHRRRRRRHVWKDKHFRWVPDGQGDWRVQAYVYRHHHKPKRGHFRGPGVKPSRRAAAAAPAPAISASDPRPPGAFQGDFGHAQAVRLLQRAGFGPVPGQADQLASMGLVGAVQSLTRPSGSAVLSGPAPRDDDGNPLAPADAWGHDHLWWLDRMVRTSRPLVERMTLVWHDWFATSNEGVGQQALMLDQNALFRRHALGSFGQLVHDVTRDPAMIVWLNLDQNTRWDPNENYAREVMELFTLGANRGAYSENDVREMARALTGFDEDWSAELGLHNFRFVPSRHDTTNKTIFGQTGAFDWEDAARMVVHHSLHPSFFVNKLWSYFIPVPPSATERQKLEAAYVSSGYQVRPVLEAILLHPQLHQGPRMVKPPVVFLAGMLRALRRAIDQDWWIWLCETAGQRLFYPPDVSGWDDAKWLDTSTMQGRWQLVTHAIYGRQIQGTALNNYDATETAAQSLAAAGAFWGDPSLTPESTTVL